jgi:hypothetical protein
LDLIILRPHRNIIYLEGFFCLFDFDYNLIFQCSKIQNICYHHDVVQKSP